MCVGGNGERMRMHIGVCYGWVGEGVERGDWEGDGSGKGSGKGVGKGLRDGWEERWGLRLGLEGHRSKTQGEMRWDHRGGLVFVSVCVMGWVSGCGVRREGLLTRAGHY